MKIRLSELRQIIREEIVNIKKLKESKLSSLAKGIINEESKPFLGKANSYAKAMNKAIPKELLKQYKNGVSTNSNMSTGGVGFSLYVGYRTKYYIYVNSGDATIGNQNDKPQWPEKFTKYNVVVTVSTGGDNFERPANFLKDTIKGFDSDAQAQEYCRELLQQYLLKPEDRQK